MQLLIAHIDYLIVVLKQADRNEEVGLLNIIRLLVPVMPQPELVLDSLKTLYPLYPVGRAQ